MIFNDLWLYAGYGCSIFAVYKIDGLIVKKIGRNSLPTKKERKKIGKTIEAYILSFNFEVGLFVFYFCLFLGL